MKVDKPKPEPIPKPEPKKYYSVTMWKGIKQVFKCEICGTFRDTKDAVIEHLLLHFPRSQQESILDQLVKE